MTNTLKKEILRIIEEKKDYKMNNIKGVVLVVKNNRIIEVCPFKDESEAENLFIQQFNSYVSNYDEYSENDINYIITRGYELIGSGEIKIWWFNNN